MLVVDKGGNLFDDRRKGNRRKENIEVENDRRKSERRTEIQSRNNGNDEKQDGE